MKRNTFEKRFLHFVTIFSGSLLVMLLRKSPIKDWLLVYLLNAISNGLIDHILTSYNILKYPVRYLPKIFKLHISFDFLMYPTLTVLYNQLTAKDKPPVLFYKLLFLTVPMALIEYWAVKNTHLIRWSRKWKWYYSFTSITIKSLLTRGTMGLIRYVESKQSI